MPTDIHILHIEDDPDDRAAFAWAFARSGLPGTLHSVPGSQEALLFLDQAGQYHDAPRPHLIILDLSLPWIDGRCLLAIIKHGERLKGIPVVVLTGSASSIDASACQSLDARAYLVKPADMEALGAQIRSLREHLPASGMIGSDGAPGAG